MRHAITTTKQRSRPGKRSLLKANAARQAKKSCKTRIAPVWITLFTKYQRNGPDAQALA